jgi:serine/threonine protein kinase
VFGPFLERAIASMLEQRKLDGDAKARFLREARVLSKLEHPNICTVHDIADTDEGQTYIVMSYYDGETLKRKLARGSLKVEQVLDLGAQIADGLAKAHENGIVHRDIKPANVMV